MLNECADGELHGVFRRAIAEPVQKLGHTDGIDIAGFVVAIARYDHRQNRYCLSVTFARLANDWQGLDIQKLRE